MNPLSMSPAGVMMTYRPGRALREPAISFKGATPSGSTFSDAWIDRQVTRPLREALVYVSKRKIKRAVATAARALEMAEMLEGENIHLARAQAVRGFCLMRQSELTPKPDKQLLGRAEHLLRKANGFYDSDYQGLKVPQARAVEPLQCKVWLAQACNLQGSKPMASAYLVEADSYAQRKGLQEHPLTAQANRDLGIILHDRGDFQGADRAFVRSLRLYDKLPNSPEKAEACNTYADLLEDTGRQPKAQKFRRVAQVILLNTIDAIHRRFYE